MTVCLVFVRANSQQLCGKMTEIKQIGINSVYADEWLYKLRESVKHMRHI